MDLANTKYQKFWPQPSLYIDADFPISGGQLLTVKWKLIIIHHNELFNVQCRAHVF